MCDVKRIVWKKNTIAIALEGKLKIEDCKLP